MVKTEPIKQALLKKGWIAQAIDHEPVYYGREGREGGWYISIDDESCSDEVYAKLQELEKVDFADGDFMCGVIVAYKKKRCLTSLKDCLCLRHFPKRLWRKEAC